VGIIVDLHADGSVLGVEILNPSRLAFGVSKGKASYD
jgi:uncharacterized protein YuzE